MNISIIILSIALVIDMIALSISLLSLRSLIRPIYVTDYYGNENRARIRMAKSIPNNGLLYRYEHNIRHEMTFEEVQNKKYDWIESNKDEYDDMMRQRYSKHPYNNIKVRVI